MVKFILTADEINENYDWKVFCEIKEFDVNSLNEGKILDDDEFELTIEEFKKIGGKV